MSGLGGDKINSVTAAFPQGDSGDIESSMQIPIDSLPANVKICQCCGAPFSRPTGTNRISDKRWQDRNNCSFRCAFYQANGKGGPRPQSEETYSRAAVACNAHLRALIRYGLRNDGLPGLAATDLLRMAGEMGIAA